MEGAYNKDGKGLSIKLMYHRMELCIHSMNQ
ncbi:hypothetical protein ACEQPO_29115 [Bacillus sp. SL00103]